MWSYSDIQSSGSSTTFLWAHTHRWQGRGPGAYLNSNIAVGRGCTQVVGTMLCFMAGAISIRPEEFDSPHHLSGIRFKFRDHGHRNTIESRNGPMQDSG